MKDGYRHEYKYLISTVSAELLKNIFWNVGKSPDNLTNTSIKAKKNADVIRKSIALFLLLIFIFITSAKHYTISR